MCPNMNIYLSTGIKTLPNNIFTNRLDIKLKDKNYNKVTHFLEKC